MHTPTFRALLFDVGDTLWHADAAPPSAVFRQLAAARAAACLAALGLPEADPDLAARTAWDSLERAMKRARATDLIEPDYAEVARRALADAGIALDRDQTATFLETIYVSGPEGGKRAYDDAAATLRALRARGFRLAVVTNRAFGGERFRQDLVELGLDCGWESMSVSVEVGVLKPHPRIFEHALAALAIRADEALMVGNSLHEDVAGAQRLGIAAAWRRWKPDAEGVVPEYTIDAVSELLAIPALREARA
jgi:FMN phosphatase YigB (HAD superfamily)